MTGTCVGGLIVHFDGTIAGCTEDDEPEGCAGLDARHQGDPHRCVEWWGRCDRCGIQP